MMFFGFAVQFVMVMVDALTAPAGVVVGLVGEGPDALQLGPGLGLGLGLELEPELPHAAMAKAAAAAKAAAVEIRTRVLIRMSPLDLKSGERVTWR
jgi:hypothetical protein